MDISFHNFTSSGHCFWEKTSNGCKDDEDTFTHNAYDFYELCRAGERKGAEFQCKQAPAKLGEGQCKDRDDSTAKIHAPNKGRNSYYSYYYYSPAKGKSKGKSSKPKGYEKKKGRISSYDSSYYYYSYAKAKSKGKSKGKSSKSKGNDSYDYSYYSPTKKKKKNKFCFDCQESAWMCRAFACHGICQSVLKGR